MACEHLIRRRLITVDELKTLPTPILFHVGVHGEKEKEDYVEDSIFIDFESLLGVESPDKKSFVLPDMNEFAKSMMKHGLNPGSLIAVYAPSGIHMAARFWWMPKTLGIIGYVIYDYENLKVYDYVRPKTQNFETLVYDESHVVEFEDVQKMIDNPNYYIVDSRDEDVYSGAERPSNPLSGHIPGAHNHFYAKLIEEGIPDYPEINMVFPIEDEMIILYCNSGATSTINALLLESISRDYKLYPGSFKDWIMHHGEIEID